MKTFKTILTVLFLVNAFALILIANFNTKAPVSERILNLNALSAVETSPNRFHDPVAAYHILSKLDAYEPLDPTMTPEQIRQKDISGTFKGLKTDDHYCDKHRAYFVYNPDFIFNQKNFISSYMLVSDLRKAIIPKIGGNDTMPYINGGMLKSLRGQSIHDIRLDTQVYFMSAEFRREINKQFACTTQAFNHIPGHSSLYRKDYVTQGVIKYIKKYENIPQCGSGDYYFPPTLALDDEEQCVQFFKHFNSEAYQQQKRERNIVYFRKIGANAHMGQGVFPVDSKEEAKIRNQYKNGSLCGQDFSNNLMQYYIHNPLLVNGRKSDFRVYYLIASTNPMIVYYNDGYFSISLTQFESNSTEKGTFLTNARIAHEYFKDSQNTGKFSNMTEDDLWEDTVWTFETFQNYLLGQGLISDNKWLENYLRPELMKMVAHSIRMSQHSFAKRSSLFEIYGVDVVIDKDLKVWFIEANANPDMEISTVSAGVKQVIKDFWFDSFDVVFGLMRSRTKRIIKYINQLTNSPSVWKINENEYHIEDLEARKREFKQISQNYFEPEYDVPSKTRFLKVIDESLEGTAKYNHMFPAECL